MNRSELIEFLALMNLEIDTDMDMDFEQPLLTVKYKGETIYDERKENERLREEYFSVEPQPGSGRYNYKIVSEALNLCKRGPERPKMTVTKTGEEK